LIFKHHSSFLTEEFLMKVITQSGFGRASALLTSAVLLTVLPVVEAGVVSAAPKSGAVAVKDSGLVASPVTQALQKLKRSDRRWIEVNLTTQRLTAWEGNQPIHAVIVSTGKKTTPTPTGVFAVQSKFESKRMQGDDYDVPGVPFTMFYDGNYAIHGAYWHNRFGTPVSHGCVNVAVDHAEWLFKWAEVGTPVVVRR
jgi:lipoprotein-anchoring transpeptidase ErfK/SrfK